MGSTTTGIPPGAPLGDEFLQQPRGEDAFGVIGQHQGVEAGQAGVQKFSGRGLEGGGGRGSGLPVDAHHLLGGADDPGLPGGAAPLVGEEAVHGHSQPDHFLLEQVAGVIIAHQAQDLDLGPQGHQVVDDVAGAPQGAGLPLDLHHRHRGLRGDALHLAPEILVQHKVPGHQDPEVGESLQVQVTEAIAEHFGPIR